MTAVDRCVGHAEGAAGEDDAARSRRDHGRRQSGERRRFYVGGVASVWFAACSGRDVVCRQIAKASLSNATATRRVTGSSTASS
jgi:hypothetical protein